MAVRGIVNIPKALYTNTAHRIDFIIYSDPDWQTRKDISGETIELLVKDAGGTLRTYTATIDDGPNGEGHFQLTAAWHVTEGDVEAQLVEEGIPIESYQGYIREKLS